MVFHFQRSSHACTLLTTTQTYHFSKCPLALLCIIASSLFTGSFHSISKTPQYLSSENIISLDPTSLCQFLPHLSVFIYSKTSWELSLLITSNFSQSDFQHKNTWQGPQWLVFGQIQVINSLPLCYSIWSVAFDANKHSSFKHCLHSASGTLLPFLHISCQCSSVSSAASASFPITKGQE